MVLGTQTGPYISSGITPSQSAGLAKFVQRLHFQVVDLGNLAFMFLGSPISKWVNTHFIAVEIKHKPNA